MTNSEFISENIHQCESASILLCGEVVFDPLKRTLTGKTISVSLSESESCLLKMLLEKTCSKREIIYAVWERRGVIVTESSYYKLIRQLRSSFKKVNLDESLIATLPRIGVVYNGTKAVPIETTSDVNSGLKNILDFSNTILMLTLSIIFLLFITLYWK